MLSKLPAIQPIAFQKRIIEKDQMTREQRSFLNDLVDEYLEMADTNKTIAELDKYGIDVRIKRLGQSNLQIGLEKNLKPVRDKNSKEVVKKLAPTMFIRELEDVLTDFKTKCLNVMQREDTKIINSNLSKAAKLKNKKE